MFGKTGKEQKNEQSAAKDPNVLKEGQHQDIQPMGNEAANVDHSYKFTFLVHNQLLISCLFWELSGVIGSYRELTDDTIVLLRMGPKTYVR